ncbi:MAG: conjugative transposon protein TraM [Prevotella sp.]|mgnify:FL=1|jgi:conjugative transposon TraM protein|nr:conjugative transposon protein TraM [Prevotella sp.]
MKLTDKINFRQPKYMLPLIVYLPVIGTAYFVFDMFDTKIEDKPAANLQTTEYLNSDLPEAQIKGGDGIGGRYESMVKSYGKIEDHSAISNIDRNNQDEKEAYESKYSDAELEMLDKEAAQSASLQDKELQEANARERDRQALAELQKALAEARLSGQKGLEPDSGKSDGSPESDGKVEMKGKIEINDKAVKGLSDAEKPSEVVKKVKTSSDYFNTLTENEKEPNLIKAIIDENVKAVDGSRVRLRLLDDIEIGVTVVRKGSYLYATMSGFGSQRVKGNVKSLLVDDELVKINLSIYDTDGLEGLYVPSSSFRETTKDVASGAMSSTMDMNTTGTGSSFSQWGMQAVSNAYQKTSNAIGKAIKKNKVKLKYGTFVYLINGQQKSNQ